MPGDFLPRLTGSTTDSGTWRAPPGFTAACSGSDRDREAGPDAYDQPAHRVVVEPDAAVGDRASEHAADVHQSGRGAERAATRHPSQSHGRSPGAPSADR